MVVSPFPSIINGCLLASLGTYKVQSLWTPRMLPCVVLDGEEFRVLPERSRGKEVAEKTRWNFTQKAMELPSLNLTVCQKKPAKITGWKMMLFYHLFFREKNLLLVLGDASWTVGNSCHSWHSSHSCHHMPPGKLTCPLKITGWKMYFLLK